MFGSEILDVAIGLCLIFLSVSLICTAAREGLEGILKMRSMDLERGIRELLNDPDGSTIAKSFYEHPLIYALYSGTYDPAKLKATVNPLASPGMRMSFWARRNLPSYIPASSFAGALMDIVARGAMSGTPYPSPMGQTLSVEKLRASVYTLPSDKLQRALLSAIDLAQGDLDAAKKNLESWFDSSMDRVSGWYKRRTQLFLFLLGLTVAVAMNIDAIHLTERVSRDKALRTTLVQQADKIVTPPAGVNTPNETLANLQKQSFAEVKAQLDDLGLPIGWSSPVPQLEAACAARQPAASAAPAGSAAPCTKRHSDTYTYFKMGLGWLITALAVMLGAPFWFDLLNKFMVIRATVKPHEKSPEEGSEDRAASPPAAPPAGSGRKKATPPPGGGGAAAPAVEAPPFEPHAWKGGERQEGTI